MMLTQDVEPRRLLMVGAGIMGSGYVDAAVRRGFEVGLVERDRWFDTYRDRVAMCFPCTASTDEHWTAAAVAAARRWQPDLVLGFAEPQVLAAAWLQDSEGLPGPGLRAAVASRDKGLQRTLGAVAYVPQPDFVLARSVDEARAFSADRYPVMVKARRSSGSRGVVSVVDDTELSAMRDGWSETEPVLVERRVDGPEFSCELLVRDGEIRCARTPTPDTGSLRGDALELLRQANSTWSSPRGAILRDLLAAAADEPELLELLREQAGASAMDAAWLTVLSRAVARGEAPPEALHPRVAKLPMMLLRSEYAVRGVPAVPDEVLADIVDEILLPLVRGRAR